MQARIFRFRKNDTYHKQKDILCTVNVQHNCVQHNCATAHVHHIYQEHECTDQTQPAVSHIHNPKDVVLNTVQMRDAVHVWRFQLQSPILDAEQIITTSAAWEVVLQKAAHKALDSAVTASPVPQHFGQPW